MPRIRITPRPEYPFATELTVRTTDLNYGGHLGNDRILALAHEARVAFLAAHRWTELDCAGVGLIMGDAAVVFRAEAFAGDVLRIEVAAVEAGRSDFRLAYRLTRAGDEREIALVETGMVCFDYRKRRVSALPDAVREVCR